MALRNGSGKQNDDGAALPTKAVRCAIYTRKSTDEGLQQEFNSLDAQREAGEAYILSQRHEGWQLLPARYDDGGYTGGNMERPGLKKLLGDIETAKVDCVVVYKVDRLSRSLMDFARIIEVFDKRGVSFVSVTQQFNTTNSLGRLTLNILLSFAQFEREIISERTRDKQSAARRKGKWIGGHPILGYDIDPRGGRLVVNEEEAARVRGMFDLYIEHQAAIAVVDELRRRDWRTKNWLSAEGRAHGGKPFTKSRLYGLLTNVVYAGKVNHKGTIYEGEQDGIVDVKIWERVQKLLGRNGAAHRDRTRNKYGALLHGLVVCATCNAPMISTYTMRGAKRYRYYVCLNAQQRGWNTCETKSVAAHAIEAAVVESIRRLGSDPEIARRTVEHARAQVGARTEQLETDEAAARIQLRRLNAEMACAATVSGKVDGSAARFDRLVTGHKEVQVVEERLVTIRAELDALLDDPLDQADVLSALEDFDAVWNSLRSHQQTRMVNLLVERVGYDGRSGKVTVAFRSQGMRELCSGRMAE
jgi:site-specific DNA recombinase